jgi:hypothetical protein
MLTDQLIPDLWTSQAINMDTLWFQQDGAPAHTSYLARDVLNEHFDRTRVIAKFFPFAWPPRSPDLTVCDYHFWGVHKHLTYQNPTPNIAVLKRVICEVATTMKQSAHHMRVFYPLLCHSLFAKNFAIFRAFIWLSLGLCLRD